MPKHQCKNTINNSQGKIAPPEPSCPTTAILKHFNADGVQESNLKNNFEKMIQFLKYDIKNLIKEIREKNNQKFREKQQISNTKQTDKESYLFWGIFCLYFNK